MSIRSAARWQALANAVNFLGKGYNTSTASPNTLPLPKTLHGRVWGRGCVAGVGSPSGLPRPQILTIRMETSATLSPWILMMIKMRVPCSAAPASPGVKAHSLPTFFVRGILYALQSTGGRLKRVRTAFEEGSEHPLQGFPPRQGGETLVARAIWHFMESSNISCMFRICEKSAIAPAAWPGGPARPARPPGPSVSSEAGLTG